MNEHATLFPSREMRSIYLANIGIPPALYSEPSLGMRLDPLLFVDDVIACTI